MLETSLLSSRFESLISKEAELVFAALNQKVFADIILDAVPDEEAFDRRRMILPENVNFSHVESPPAYGELKIGSHFTQTIHIYTKPIALWASKIVQESSNDSVFDGSLFREVNEFILLLTFVHEQIHAFAALNSHYVVSKDKDNRISQVTQKTTHGFRVIKKHANNWVDIDKNNFSDVQILGEQIDEAFVETMAIEIVKKYFSIEGGRYVQPGDAMRVTALVLEKSGLYRRRMWVLEQLMCLLAVVLNKSEEEIKSAIAKSFTSLASVVPQDISDNLERLSPKLTEELNNALLGNLDSEESDVYGVFLKVIDILPGDQAHMVKDRFGEIYKKFNNSNSRMENWRTEN